MIRIGWIALMIACGSLSSVTAAPIYDLANDLSLTANPNGVWTYGFRSTLAGELSFYTNRTTFFDTGSGGGAMAVLYGSPGFYPSLFYNNTSLPYESIDPGPGLLPGQLTLHANLGLLSVTRFTSPSAGTFLIDVEFYGVTSDTTSVFVLLNGTPLLSGSHAGFSSGNEVRYRQVHTLAAGDLVEFAVGDGGNGSANYDWLGLEARVSSTEAAVPEPAAITNLLLAMSLGATHVLYRSARRNGP